MDQDSPQGGRLGAAADPNGMQNFLEQAGVSPTDPQQVQEPAAPSPSVPPQQTTSGGAASYPPPAQDPTLATQQGSPQVHPPTSFAPQPVSTLSDLSPHYAKGGAVTLPNLDLINARPGREKPHPKMILAHVMESELRGLDNMQGGRLIDPETGLPEYSQIAKMLEDPDVVHIFEEIFSQEQAGGIQPEIQALAAQIDARNPPSPSHEEMPYPEERLIAHEGIQPDTALALIPLKLADFLDALRGEVRTNPKTGLPEYFLESMGSWLPMAATLAGGVMSIFDDEDRDADMRMMRAHRQAQMDADHYERRERHEKKHREGTHYLRTERERGQQHPYTLAPLQQPPGDPSLLLNFAAGGHADVPPGIDKSKVVETAPMQTSRIIKGPGKGQDDVIKTAVPAQSYIIDATTLSSVGDGSSEAGARVFDQFVQKLGRGQDDPRHSPDPREEGGSVPVMLSNDEYLIEPHVVEALGDGKNQEGARLLKGMVKNIRKHKMSNGLNLPPKAKDLLAYLPRR